MKYKFLSLAFIIVLCSCKSGKDNNVNQEILESDYFHVISIDNKNVKDENVTMRIDLEEHLVSGNTGCNTYGADFIQNGTSINVGMARVTKRYCESKMKTERLFLKNLKDSKFYAFDGEKLKLQSAEGDVLMIAKRIDEEDN